LTPHDEYQTPGGEITPGDSPTPLGLESENIFDNSKDNVKVCVRIRPLSEKEMRGNGKNGCLQSENGIIKVNRGMDIKKFNFDYVGDQYVE
jgi:hypothetical protein